MDHQTVGVGSKTLGEGEWWVGSDIYTTIVKFVLPL